MSGFHESKHHIVIPARLYKLSCPLVVRFGRLIKFCPWMRVFLLKCNCKITTLRNQRVWIIKIEETKIYVLNFPFFNEFYTLCNRRHHRRLEAYRTAIIVLYAFRISNSFFFVSENATTNKNLRLKLEIRVIERRAAQSRRLVVVVTSFLRSKNFFSLKINKSSVSPATDVPLYTTYDNR